MTPSVFINHFLANITCNYLTVKHAHPIELLNVTKHLHKKKKNLLLKGFENPYEHHRNSSRQKNLINVLI